MALSVALLAGCSSVDPVWTFPNGSWTATTVAGLAVTDGESGPKPGVPDADIRVQNKSDSEIDRLAANAVADVQDYWRAQLPESFGTEFEPIRRLLSYDSTKDELAVCGVSTRDLVNALYCSADDTVAWDRGQLLPLLNDSFGSMAVVTVLAHEVGHAVQTRLGPAANLDDNTPSIVKEQQADCNTGSFFRWMAEGRAAHFQVSTGPGLNQVLQTLFFIRDSAGSSFEDQGAHGSAFDRVSAFQLGFGEGPDRCAQIDPAEIEQRITQRTSDREEDQGLGAGNLRVDDRDALADLRRSLDNTFVRAGTTRPSMDTEESGCADDTPRTSPAAYCREENAVRVDIDDLVRIGTPAASGQGEGIGDFAAFAEVASRYALWHQNADGDELTGMAAAQRTACLTGVWAASIQPEREEALLLSPGDLDEAIAEMLLPQSLIAADVTGQSVPSGFARVAAFREGFNVGSTSACREMFA
ncbi:neutral zinc metallopeptidase [Phytohabitans flavus]